MILLYILLVWVLFALAFGVVCFLDPREDHKFGKHNKHCFQVGLICGIFFPFIPIFSILRKFKLIK